MHPHRTGVRNLAGFALSLAFVACTAAVSPAQVNPAWDYYRVYEAAADPTLPIPIGLTDRFGITDQYAQSIDLFAKPAAMEHGPLTFGLHNPDLHYAWWKLDPEIAVNRTVFVSNHFGDQTLALDRIVYLLSPAFITWETTSPPVANRYKCYSCTGQPINVEVYLDYEMWARPVLFPRFFCTPTSVSQITGSYPIVDNNQQYVVYDIPPETQFFNFHMTDQFGQRNVTFTNDRLLAVPTVLMDTTPSVRSTWGWVKSQYR